MEFEFDKEIDFLLRQTAQGKAAFARANPPSNHLDADEIAAFAENALPEKARLNYVAHLADCARCRIILSSLIALDSDSQSEIIHAEEPKLTTVSPAIPWYHRLFAVPTLAYAMGALILVFSGIGLFTILQNDSMSSQISQVPEKQIGGKGMSSDGDAAAQENYSGSMSNAATTNSNPMSANTTANVSNSASAVAPTAPSGLSAANANAAMTQREPKQSSTDDDSRVDKSLAADNKSAEKKDSAASGAPPPAPSVAELRAEDSEKSPQPTPEAEEKVRQPNPAKPSLARPAPSAKMRKAEEAQKQKDSEETTTVGGKTFKRAANTWVDTTYRGQATTNISRGTSEYKNLDSGLRGIVENLGGTVVVVWKEKAYRIQ